MHQRCCSSNSRPCRCAVRNSELLSCWLGLQAYACSRHATSLHAHLLIQQLSPVHPSVTLTDSMGKAHLDSCQSSSAQLLVLCMLCTDVGCLCAGRLRKIPVTQPPCS